MSAREVPREWVEQAVEYAAVELAEDYSGRSMYGEVCFGIITDDLGAAKPGRFVLSLYEHDKQLADDLLQAARQDDLGKGMIVYYPGFVVG